MQVRSYLSTTGADGTFEAHGAPLGATVRVEVDGYEVVAPRELVLRQRETRDVEVDVLGMGSLAGVVTRDGAPSPGANAGWAVRRTTVNE